LESERGFSSVKKKKGGSGSIKKTVVYCSPTGRTSPRGVGKKQPSGGGGSGVMLNLKNQRPVRLPLDNRKKFQKCSKKGTPNLEGSQPPGRPSVCKKVTRGRISMKSHEEKVKTHNQRSPRNQRTTTLKGVGDQSRGGPGKRRTGTIWGETNYSLPHPKKRGGAPRNKQSRVPGRGNHLRPERMKKKSLGNNNQQPGF